MANYVVDPTDPTQPTNSRGARQGAEELRALKGLIQTLLGGSAVSPVNVFRRNAIIGGDFDTNPWQRGVNFVGIADAVYSADRWKRQKVGTMVEDITKTADAPILNTSYKNKVMDLFAVNCFQANVTTAQAVLGAGDFSFFTQVIEGSNWKLLAQIPIVLSFWHKHTKAGTYCVAFRNAGPDRSYIAEYAQTVADTWEYESLPIPASPVAGTWNYTNTSGLILSFTRGCGATYQTPAGLWAVGNFLASANQVNSLDAIGNKFRIALVQLEAGIIGSKFERRTIQEELALCQRYYEKTFQEGTAPAQNVAAFCLTIRSTNVTANGTTLRWNFCVPKRGAAAATITTYNPFVANANWRDTTNAVDKLPLIDSIDQSGVSITIASVPGSVGALHNIHATADAEL